MAQNKAFQHALNCLAHPLATLASLVLILNALFWQPNSPSWWSGKIGDVAWLLFAPFVVAALLAWLIPMSWRRQETSVALVAMIVVGIAFTSVKIIPQVNALVVSWFRALTGYPPKLTVDPTDLIALPSLLVAWWLWNHISGQPRPSVRQGLSCLLAILALVADSPPPMRNGVQCLSQDGSTILAYREVGPQRYFLEETHYWESYGSEDGGLNWRFMTSRFDNPCSAASAKNSIIDQTTGNRIVSNGEYNVQVFTPDGVLHRVEVGPRY